MVRDPGPRPGVSTYLWDLAAGVVILSPDAQDLLGVAGPIPTDAFSRIVHPEDRAMFEAETAPSPEAGGARTRAFRLLRPDGAVRHVISQEILAPSRGADGATISGILLDVTELRRTAETADAARDERFGFYDLDVRSGTSQLSPSLRRMLDLPRDESSTVEAIRRSIHPDDREWATAGMEAAERAPGPYELTYRVVLSGGRTLWVRDRGEAHAPLDPRTGTVRRITGTLSDITGRVEATSARKLANETFWRLIDTAPVGAYAVDADLRLVRINRVGLATFAEIDGLIGRDLDEVLHILWNEPFASDAVARFRHTLATGESHHADPVIEERADRKVLEAYDWSIERIDLEDGQPGVLCYFYDLSERVRHERLMEEQRQRLTLAYDAARMGAWDTDLLTGETSGTSQLSALLGEPAFTGDMGGLWRRATHPEDRPMVEAAFAAAIRDDTLFDVDFRIVAEGGEVRHIAAMGVAVRDHKGRPVRMIGVDQDITARREAGLMVSRSEERLRMVLDHTHAFVGVLSPDGTLQEVNETALAFTGLSRADVIGRPFWETFWWTHDPAISERCRHAVVAGQAGRSERCDVVVRGAGDQLITMDFMLAPVFDEAGTLKMIVVSSFDISDREEARARERALMGEINHRTKNILTLVQVVARQTARGGAADFVARFQERVSALAKAQDLLFGSASDRVDLRDLARSQLGHFQDEIDGRIALDGPPVLLSPPAAQAIGMALHELATNASKYGALSAGEGHVDVRWRTDEDAGTFEIRWAERDGPPVVPPESKGFGSTVIDQMARSVLEADVRLDYVPDGVRWRLTCAIDAIAKPR